MTGFVSRIFLVLGISAMSSLPAAADDAADKAAIAARLRAFSHAFNARDEARLCDIFAPDLVATIPRGPEVDRTTLCGNLHRLLTMPGLQLRYDLPDIREIIISGDLAAVRVIWTLTARRGDEQDTTQEGGVDIFRREPDGRWSIARMAAFPFRPNRILD